MTSSFFKLFAPPVQAMLDPTDSSEPPSLRDDVPETIGLLSTPELDSVLEECRSHVARIAQQCRARNLRYRDIDFDIENDQDRCLNGLLVSEVYHPADVQRVSELFEKPRFFVGGPYSNEIIQGQKCSNCWFISALASTSTVKGLVQKYCVARDEAVGVYGFVFWRDMQWVSVIVDDLLYTSVPKYEELSLAEKALFQNDKDQYNASARKGSKTLYFAKSGTVGETWVPLVEKAYAKLHGDYASLASGYASEGVEDLTGGVSSFIQCKDILDRDKFWTSELLKANIDRVFACSFQGLSPTRNGNFNATVNGLWGNHSYAVLRALEYLGRRFLVLRNPCGQAEWNGPWSDGSKNWTPESMEALPALGHVFGDPGKFIMEYKDFLSCFEQVDRTRLFDSSWTMKHEVLRVPSRPFPGSGFGYGDLCFTFSLPKTTFTILVLSQLDSRYFKGIAAPCYWNFDFVLYRRGQKEPVDVSSHSRFTARSVSLEFPELEKGEYVVHCRLDKVPFTDNLKLNPPEEWSQSQSKLSRVITERSNSESVATNVEADFHAKNLPIPLRILAGQDLTDISRKARQLQARLKASSSKDKLKPVQEDSDSDSPPPIDANAHSTTITTITTVRGPATITTNTKEVVDLPPVPPPYPWCPPLAGLGSPTSLTHICRPWREIALATPTLWRAISLIPSDFGEEQTRAWLESSGSCPLWIEVDPDVDDDDRQISTECLKTLLLHRERWQHVELTLPEYTLDLIKGPMPLLYRLSIDVPPAPIHLGPAGGSSLYRPSACPQDFPGLREISLTNVDPVDWLPWA